MKGYIQVQEQQTRVRLLKKKTMAIPYLEYTDKDGVKSKVEFTEDWTKENFADFHAYMRTVDPYYPPND